MTSLWYVGMYIDICANFDSSCKMMIFSFFHYNVIQAIFDLKVSGVVFESLYAYLPFLQFWFLCFFQKILCHFSDLQFLQTFWCPYELKNVHIKWRSDPQKNTFLKKLPFILIDFMLVNNELLLDKDFCSIMLGKAVARSEKTKVLLFLLPQF